MLNVACKSPEHRITFIKLIYCLRKLTDFDKMARIIQTPVLLNVLPWLWYFCVHRRNGNW